MELLKKFFTSKEGKRAMWTLLNSLMAGMLSLLVYLSANDVNWAIGVYPVALVFSQMLTKFLNSNS